MGLRGLFYKSIFVFGVSLWPLAVEAAVFDTAADVCVGLATESPQAQLARVQDQLQSDLADIPTAIQSMTLDPSVLIPVKSLGSGWTAEVLEVQMGGRSVALKLFYLLNHKESTEAVLIQKALGELGFAPKVLGVITDMTALSRWIQENASTLKTFPTYFERPNVGQLRREWKDVQFAFVMEITKSESFKEIHLYGRYPKYVLSHVQYENVLAQIESLKKVFSDLDILPEDPDGVLVDGDRLQLLDIAWYTIEPGVSSIDFLGKLQDQFKAAAEIAAPVIDELKVVPPPKLKPRFIERLRQLIQRAG